MKELLSFADLREIGFGKTVADALLGFLPHIQVGSKRVVRRRELEKLLDRVSNSKEDLRVLLGVKRTGTIRKAGR